MLSLFFCKYFLIYFYCLDGSANTCTPPSPVPSAAPKIPPLGLDNPNDKATFFYAKIWCKKTWSPAPLGLDTLGLDNGEAVAAALAESDSRKGKNWNNYTS